MSQKKYDNVDERNDNLGDDPYATGKHFMISLYRVDKTVSMQKHIRDIVFKTYGFEHDMKKEVYKCIRDNNLISEETVKLLVENYHGDKVRKVASQKMLDQVFDETYTKYLMYNARIRSDMLDLIDTDVIERAYVSFMDGQYITNDRPGCKIYDLTIVLRDYNHLITNVLYDSKSLPLKNKMDIAKCSTLFKKIEVDGPQNDAERMLLALLR